MRYIVAYNAFSALAWLSILLLSLDKIMRSKYSHGSGLRVMYFTLVQTVAVLEVGSRLLPIPQNMPVEIIDRTHAH